MNIPCVQATGPFLYVKTKPMISSHDKASNVVALYLRWIYCVVFIVFIPFYRCVKVFLFPKYTCHIFLYINMLYIRFKGSEPWNVYSLYY